MKGKDTGDPDDRGIIPQGPFSRIGPQEECFSLGEEIREVAPRALAHHIIFLASAPIKEGLFPFDAHPSDEAHVGATLAFKGGDCIAALTQVEPFEVAPLPGALLFRQQSRADGPGHLMILGNGNILTQDPLKGRHHPLVEGGPSLKKYLVTDAPVPHDAIQVVLDNGVTETAQQVVGLCPLLLVMDEIGFDKDGAPFPHPYRCGGSEGLVCELFLDGDAELLCLFLKEGAGACGTHLVHVEVDDDSPLEADVFGVLSPDLKDGVHLGIDVGRRGGLGGDLVADDIRPHEVPGQVPAGSRRAHPLDLHQGPDLRPDRLQPLADGLDGPARRHEVLFGQDPFLRIDDYQICADGTNIQPQIGRYLLPGGCRLKDPPCVLQVARGEGERFPSLLLCLPLPFDIPLQQF